MKEQMRKMNVRLLRRVQKHILEEPRRLAMAAWVQKKNVTKNSWGGLSEVAEDSYSHGCTWHEFAQCKTAACIGGWAVLLEGGRVGEEMSSDRPAQKLGLSTIQAQLLFFNDNWPEKYAAAYSEAKTPAGKARVAVRRIDHFIKTRGAE